MTEHNTRNSTGTVRSGGCLRRLWLRFVGNGCAALSGALLCFAPFALLADDPGSSKRPENSGQESPNAPAQDRAGALGDSCPEFSGRFELPGSSASRANGAKQSN